MSGGGAIQSKSMDIGVDGGARFANLRPNGPNVHDDADIPTCPNAASTTLDATKPAYVPPHLRKAAAAAPPAP